VAACVRGIGLVLGLEMTNAASAEAVMYAALARGLNVKTMLGMIIHLGPALTISEADLDLGPTILDDAIGAVGVSVA